MISVFTYKIHPFVRIEGFVVDGARSNSFDKRSSKMRLPTLVYGGLLSMTLLAKSTSILKERFITFASTHTDKFGVYTRLTINDYFI